VTSVWTRKIRLYNSEMCETGGVSSIVVCVTCGHHFGSGCVSYFSMFDTVMSQYFFNDSTEGSMNSFIRVSMGRLLMCNMFHRRH
jgi:hypothetical protein